MKSLFSGSGILSTAVSSTTYRMKKTPFNLHFIPFAFSMAALDEFPPSKKKRYFT